MKLFDRLFAKPKHARDLEAELATALAANASLVEQLARVRALAETYRESSRIKRDEIMRWHVVLNRYGAALDAIGATESRNGTSQRLARMAREARHG